MGSGSSKRAVAVLIDHLKSGSVADAHLEALFSLNCDAIDFFEYFPLSALKSALDVAPRNVFKLLWMAVTLGAKVEAAVRAQNCSSDDTVVLLNCVRVIQRVVPALYAAGLERWLYEDSARLIAEMRQAAIEADASAPAADAPTAAAATSSAATTTTTTTMTMTTTTTAAAGNTQQPHSPVASDMRAAASAPSSSDTAATAVANSDEPPPPVTDATSIEPDELRDQPTKDSPPQLAPPSDKPFGHRIYDLVVRLLFLPDFTVHPAAKLRDDPFRCAWSAGIGISRAEKTNTSCDMRRVEVLRAVVTMLSQTLFFEPDTVLLKHNRMMTYATSVECPHKEILFYSLLNTVLNYDPIGWGVPYATYMSDPAPELLVQLSSEVLSLLFSNVHFVEVSPEEAARQRAEAQRAQDQHRDLFPSAASGTLMAASAVAAAPDAAATAADAAAAAAAAPASASSDESTSAAAAPASVPDASPESVVRHPSDDDVDGRDSVDSATSTASGASDAAPASTTASAAAAAAAPVAAPRKSYVLEYNHFRYLLSALGGDVDMHMLAHGLRRLLHSHIEAKNTFLPAARRGLHCWEDVVTLLWHCCESNLRFRTFLTHSAEFHDVLSSIMYLSYEHRRAPGKEGLIYMIACLLMMLSADRQFGIALNRKLPKALPFDLPQTQATYMDVLIMVLHKLIFNGPQPRSELLLTVLCSTFVNVSPYIKSLNPVASLKLVNLVDAFSKPRVLASHPRYHQFLQDFLTVLNNVIQYQFEGNAHLSYTLVRRRDIFDRIRELRYETFLTLAPARDSHDLDAAEAHGPSSAAPAPADAPTSSAATTQVESKPTQAAVAHPKFEPTQEWFDSWYGRLDLQPVLVLLQQLTAPLIGISQTSSDEEAVLKYIASTTLVGALPRPHPIMVRVYRRNGTIDSHTAAVTWASTFVRSFNPPLFAGLDVHLFMVRAASSTKS